MSKTLRDAAGRVPDMLQKFPLPEKMNKYIQACKAVAFIRVYRLGCIITARWGNGVMVMKTGADAEGNPTWGPPSGVAVTGIAAAAAIGLEFTDFVTFIMEDNMHSIYAGNNLGVSTNLCFALGPFGSAAEAGLQTGGKEVSKMIGRSTGIFAGGTLEFSGILVDANTNKAQYPDQKDAIIRDILKGENGIEKPNDTEFNRMYEALSRQYSEATSGVVQKVISSPDVISSAEIVTEDAKPEAG